MSPPEINPIEILSKENNNYEIQDTEFKRTNTNMFNDFKAVKPNTDNHWANWRGREWNYWSQKNHKQTAEWNNEDNSGNEIPIQ